VGIEALTSATDILCTYFDVYKYLLSKSEKKMVLLVNRTIYISLGLEN